jgi:predicted outer membrane lipoprotein
LNAAAQVEEVLRHMQQSAAFNVLTELLLHFPDDRRRGRLAHVDSAARESPVVVSRGSVKQDVARMQDDRGGTNLEVLTLKMH